MYFSLSVLRCAKCDCKEALQKLFKPGEVDCSLRQLSQKTLSGPLQLRSLRGESLSMRLTDNLKLLFRPALNLQTSTNIGTKQNGWASPPALGESHGYAVIFLLDFIAWIRLQSSWISHENQMSIPGIKSNDTLPERCLE